MALITDDPVLRSAPSAAVGLLACVRPVGRGTELDVLTDVASAGSAGIVTVVVPTVADHPAADLLLAGVRVIWQRIDLRGAETTCSVAAVGHRRPVRRPVRLATALALAGRGVTTMVVAPGEDR